MASQPADTQHPARELALLGSSSALRVTMIPDLALRHVPSVVPTGPHPSRLSGAVSGRYGGSALATWPRAWPAVPGRQDPGCLSRYHLYTLWMWMDFL